MRFLAALFCVCSAVALSHAADYVKVALQEQGIIVAQTQIPAEQMPAQKAVFVGIEKLEPQLVRTALAVLIVRGQKVPAMAALDALVKVNQRYISKSEWAVFGCLACFVYAFSEPFLRDWHRIHGQHHEDDVGRLLWIVVGVSGLALIARHDKEQRIVADIVDELLDAHSALDFGENRHEFIRRALNLERVVLGDDVFERKLPDLSEKLLFADITPRLAAQKAETLCLIGRLIPKFVIK